LVVGAILFAGACGKIRPLSLPDAGGGGEDRQTPGTPPTVPEAGIEPAPDGAVETAPEPGADARPESRPDAAPSPACAALDGCACIKTPGCKPIAEGCWCPFPACDPSSACGCSGGRFFRCAPIVAPPCLESAARVAALCGRSVTTLCAWPR